MSKVFIIEDSEDDYELLVGCLENYEVTYYPGTKAFGEFSDQLIDFARHSVDENMEKIKAIVEREQPDVIFMDIVLDPRNTADKSGLVLRDKLFTSHAANGKLYYLSHSDAGVGKGDKVINKMSEKGLDEEVRLVMDDAFGMHKKKGAAKKQDDDRSIPPEWLRKFAKNRQYKFIMIARYLMNIWMMLIFYFSLFALAGVGIVWLLKSSYEIYIKGDSFIGIAENCFVAFLPFMIVFGFFVYYTDVLKNYFKWEQVTPKNYELSVGLIRVTKKLFISSLISYLFIKLIEMLMPEEKGKTVALVVNDSFITKVGFVGLLALVIICFYIYLESHHVESMEEKRPNE